MSANENASEKQRLHHPPELIYLADGKITEAIDRCFDDTNIESFEVLQELLLDVQEVLQSQKKHIGELQEKINNEQSRESTEEIYTRALKELKGRHLLIPVDPSVQESFENAMRLSIESDQYPETDQTAIYITMIGHILNRKFS